MSHSKLVKMIMDATTLTGLAVGIGWIARKMVKEKFTAGPSRNVMNKAKLTPAMASHVALKQLKTRRFFGQIEKIGMLYIASDAKMIRGAILNTTAFTGNNYVAKYLSGDGLAVLDEKARDDNALQAY